MEKRKLKTVEKVTIYHFYMAILAFIASGLNLLTGDSVSMLLCMILAAILGGIGEILYVLKTK